jgi:NAD(P)-dependent dehydrogenase (short-subunit alcohol dehydrogenase family)
MIDATKLFSLDGRNALVTGASSGLGRHFAEVLASAGAAVALAARRTDRLEVLADKIVENGGKAVCVALDVTNAASVAAGMEAAEKALGPITVLVNNAGIATNSRFLNVSEEEWRSVLDVNLDGVFRVGQAAAQRMVANKSGGTIINIASILALGVIRRLSPYAASKGAVVQLTKAMALELGRDNIRVNAIAPGYVSTEMNADFLVSEGGKKLLSRVPMGRAANLDELDGALLLLASDAGRFMTGSVVTVDGGHAMAMG